jgi:hypothetical protein
MVSRSPKSAILLRRRLWDTGRDPQGKQAKASSDGPVGDLVYSNKILETPRPTCNSKFGVVKVVARIHCSVLMWDRPIEVGQVAGTDLASKDLALLMTRT